MSGGYRRLEASEVPALAAELSTAWQDPSIPRLQWESCVRREIENLRAGVTLPHFEALIHALNRTGLRNPTLLEVGASSAFYSEILKLSGFDCQYSALDFSREYEKLAAELYPDIPFHLGDARALPFDDAAFDAVVSGCVLLHVAEYEKVIAETARVASQFAIFARTPVTLEGETEFYEKTGYGARMLEVHVNEYELMALFADNGLWLHSQETIFVSPMSNYKSVTYLLRKQ